MTEFYYFSRKARDAHASSLRLQGLSYDKETFDDCYGDACDIKDFITEMHREPFKGEQLMGVKLYKLSNIHSFRNVPFAHKPRPKKRLGQFG